MESEKKEASLEMMHTIVEHLSIAPSGQVEDYIRNDCKRFKSKSKTPSEYYDFIVKISKITGGDISSFVKKTCELDKYYLRPTEEKKSTIINMIRRRLKNIIRI